MTDVRLALEHIGKSWGRVAALTNISLQVQRGMFLSRCWDRVAAARPRCCASSPARWHRMGGRVVVDNVDVTRVPTYRRNMGMVFQRVSLSSRTCRSPPMWHFLLQVRGLPRSEQRERDGQARHYGWCISMRLRRPLPARAVRRPAAARRSGGKRRSSTGQPFCCSMSRCPNLDASLREEMRLEISQVTRQLGITAVYVTHDQREALALSDAIAVMNHGRIVQFGTPEEIYRSPTDDFVARFVGYANAIPIQIVGGCARVEADGSVLTTRDVSLTGAATAFIHASAVELEPAISSGPNRLHCTVADAAFMGDHVEYALRQEAGALLKARAPIGAPIFTRGTNVAVFLPPDKLIVVPRTYTDGINC